MSEQNGNGSVAMTLCEDRQPVAAMRHMSLAELERLGELMAKSNMFPDIRSAAQAVVKILAGNEIGFGPFASMADVHVIEGKPVVGAHLKAASIKRSDKYDYGIIERADAACEVEFWERTGDGPAVRKGKPGWKSVGRLRYTLADARTKGWHLTRAGKEKEPWIKTPANMLFARVLTDGYKTYCPDLSSGVLTYDPDEFDAEPASLAPRQPDPAMASLALTLTANTNLPTSPPPGLPTPAPAPVQAAPPINTIQMARIDELVEKLGVQQQAFRARVQQLYGTPDATRISGSQADDLISKLSDALRAKEASAGQLTGAGK